MPAHHPGLRRIRLLVADSTRMGAQLLAEAVQRDRRFEVVGSAATSVDILRVATNHHPDVVLISTTLDDKPLRGFELVRELRTICPDVRAVMLLDSSTPDLVVWAFRAGSRGVFCRDQPLRTLSKCIYSVHIDQIWANSEQLGFVLESLAAAGTIPRITDANGTALLSKRELDVVRSVAGGFTNREIAEQLSLSEHTVKNYLFRIFDKLGLSSRVELVLYALANENRLTSPDSASRPVRNLANLEALADARLQKAEDVCHSVSQVSGNGTV